VTFALGQHVRHQDGQEGEVVHLGYQCAVGVPLLHVQIPTPDPNSGKLPIRIALYAFWRPA
jgi:hypothetical protein